MASVHHTSLSGLGVRWAVPADLPDLTAIELQSNAFPWQTEDFLAAMAGCTPLRVPYVVEPESLDRVLGHAVVALHVDSVEIETLAVSAAYRGMGVGTILLMQTTKLLRRDKWQCRDRIIVRVPEIDLARLKFYRRCGFKARGMVRGKGDDAGIDRVHMELKVSD